MTANEKAPLSVTIESHLTPSATGVTTSSVFRVPFTGEITSFSYSALAAVTGANTNYRTLQLINHGQSGSGSVIISQRAFTLGVNLVAFDETPMTLEIGALAVVEGDIIEMKSLPTGAGLAGPGGTGYIKINRE